MTPLFAVAAMALIGAVDSHPDIAASRPGQSEAGAPVPLVRVGLKVAAPPVGIGCTGAWFAGRHRSGAAPVRLGPADRLELGRDGASLVLRGSGPGWDVNDTLYFFPADRDVDRLQVDGTAYRGEFLAWADSAGVSLVNVVDLEDYLRGVVPEEIGPQGPDGRQAVMAQAVAARSYTLATMGRWRQLGFDLYGTVEDQAYGGTRTESAACDTAIRQTRGVVLQWEGLPVRAYYSSTCGGHTAGCDEVWAKPAVPYLRGVPDRTRGMKEPFCASSPRFEWSEEWSATELEGILARQIPKVRSEWDRLKAGKLTGISIRARSESGRVSSLGIEFDHSTVVLRGDELRWVLRRPGGEGGLRSCLLGKVEVSRTRGRLDRVRVRGRGFGHGVGMCQYGAIGMAAAGYGYDEILRFYYRGAQLRRAYM